MLSFLKQIQCSLSRLLHPPLFPSHPSPSPLSPFIFPIFPPSVPLFLFLSISSPSSFLLSLFSLPFFSSLSPPPLPPPLPPILPFSLHLSSSSLSPPCILQTELLVDHIRTLQRVLKPGSKRLNWNSLGIQDYITKCEQVCECPISVNSACSEPE